MTEAIDSDPSPAAWTQRSLPNARAQTGNAASSVLLRGSTRAAGQARDVFGESLGGEFEALDQGQVRELRLVAAIAGRINVFSAAARAVIDDDIQQRPMSRQTAESRQSRLATTNSHKTSFSFLKVQRLTAVRDVMPTARLCPCFSEKYPN